ncbi:ATP-binding protein [Streptomyces sp. NPDC101118]|uniref:ATP-binding protein n=1 Tax=Streptomyces sp. NPDC101118 TaxID=3366109 RepID=UPI00381231B0
MRPRAASGLTCERARDITRLVLAARGVTGTEADDALLVVTELVSNARRHAGGVTAFRIRCVESRAVVEVSDARPDLPVNRPTPADIPGRFGWLMINQIAERVAVEPRGAGKTIAVVLPAHGRPSRRPAAAGRRGTQH